MNLLKSIYLLADSQTLFWKNDGVPFIETIRNSIEKDDLRAAYIGASNNDNPDYYEIFKSAMNLIGINDCRMIPSTPSEEDAAYLDQSDIILLAGGDVETGWRVFEETGLKERIAKRYFEGATLIGVSVGAVQLGWCGWSEDVPTSPESIIDTFKLVPFVISTHDEDRDWEPLIMALRLLEGRVHGIGIPTGSGIIFHSDRSIQPFRYAPHEFTFRDNQIIHNILLPDISWEFVESNGE